LFAGDRLACPSPDDNFDWHRNLCFCFDVIFRKRGICMCAIMPAKQADPWLTRALSAPLKRCCQRLARLRKRHYTFAATISVRDIAIRHRCGGIEAPRH